MLEEQPPEQAREDADRKEEARPAGDPAHAVRRQVKANSYIQPYTVRRLLTETAVPLDSQLGSFVGAEAYEAAGGKLTRDLFSADEDGFLDDAALVRRQ